MPRPRPRSLLVALSLVALGATACGTPSNAPEGYDDTTRSNFLQGCTGIVTEGTAEDATTSSLGAGAPLDACECRYEWFVQNVPFDRAAAEQAGRADAVNFEELNEQLVDDPDSMPQEIQDGLNQACAGGGGEDQGAPADAPASTDVGGGGEETTTTGP